MNEKTQSLTPEQKNMDILDIPVHPAADAFPMMEEEELEELAQDIKANGLQQPLVIDELGETPVLIDGRNRREACRRVGIIPDYVLLDGQDPIAYILSANVHRRNLTKGQQAIAVARICLETKQSIRDAAKQSRLKDNRVAYASTVLRHAPDLADQVVIGSLSLDKAYEEAKIRKGQAENYESIFKGIKAKYPDLADLVVEGKLSLKEAVAAEVERDEQTRHRKKLLAGALHDLARHSYLFLPNWHPKVIEFITHDQDLYKQHNCGPVDEFIQALEIFTQHAGVLLDAIREAGGKLGEEGEEPAGESSVS